MHTCNCEPAFMAAVHKEFLLPTHKQEWVVSQSITASVAFPDRLLQHPSPRLWKAPGRIGKEPRGQGHAMGLG